MSEKPNCLKCKWQREVAGSAHISCAHPKLKPMADDPLDKMFATLLGVRGIPHFVAINPIGVVGDPSGINKGWFNFPFNFDPVWLLKCKGFETK